jgi:PAS domain S-box-containing protein
MCIQPEANLSALIESTKDLIWSVDLDGRLIAFNSALSRNALEIHGVQLKAGMGPSEGLSPEIAALWPSLFERALREGPFSIEFMLADGRTLELAFNRITADGITAGISVFGKDITKRKAAEIALQEAEKRYRVIFDGAVEGIFQSSPEGKVLMVNRAAVKILGYDSLEDFQALVTNLSEQLWVDREDSAKFRRQIREQGAIQDFECRLRRKDGTIFWSLLSARKISDIDGLYLYVEGFILDITERKQAESELRDSEMSYRATIEQAAVGIAHISFEGKYLRCNARFVEIAGYPLEEVPSLTVQQVTHPADRAINESVRMRLAKGEVDHVHFEERLVRKDGSLTWVRMTTWPQRDNKGNMLYMVSLAEDINAQKVVEAQLAASQEALRLSEEHYRVAFQTSIDAITILNITNEKIVDVNQAALRMFGYVREEVLGHTFAELNLWSNPQDRSRLIEALRKENTCKDMEFHLHKKGGQKLWVQISGSRIMLAGVSSIHLVIRDVSEAKASAEALRLSEERYRAVFEASIDAIAILRMSDNKFVDCNQALLDDLGYKRDEIIGRTPRELGIWVNPDDEEIMMKLAHENSFYRRSEFQLKRKG